MSSPRAEVRRFLPLTHLEYYVLLCLAEAPAHGYALVERIRARSDGAVDPGTGSFYWIIDKLRKAALIYETGGDPIDSRRRVYATTALGRAVLHAESDRLAVQIAAARRLRLAPGTGRGGAR